MTITELGAIGELVGGVAVVASLLFVGFELRSTTSTLRARGVYDGLTQFQDLNYAIITAPQLALAASRLEAGENAEADEITSAQLRRVMRSALQHMAAQQYLHERGFFDEDLWQQYVDYARRLVHSPAGAAWWAAEQERAPYPSAFVALLATDEA